MDETGVEQARSGGITGEAGLKGQFIKGQSGNPNGRPKNRYSITSELKEIMQIMLKGEFNPLTDTPEDMPVNRKIALNLAVKGCEGDLGAIVKAIEHIDGKALQPTENKNDNTHSGGVTIRVGKEDDKELIEKL